MKILLPTVYGAIGGSTRVLQAAQRALAPAHETVVRAPFPTAGERLPFEFPVDTLASVSDKLSKLPSVFGMAMREVLALRGRGFDVIYVHDEPSLYVYGLASRLIGAKVVRHAHLRGAAWLDRLRNLLTDYEIRISEHDRGKAEGALIRNPVHVFDVQRTPVTGEIVVSGSICRRKNQMLAIEAFAALSAQGLRGVLRLCGNVLEPEYAEALRSRVAVLELSNQVRFEGMVAPQEYLATASVILAPSIHENQPLAVLEAISAQVPVVVSDIAAHRELADLACLDAGSIQPLDPARFAAAIGSAAASPEYAARVRAVFSEDRFGQELRSFFKSIESVQAS